ncbi:hypothetical protein BDR26DRAFT_937594 [Obelidium mucronatum]|nr:hypothetical protein BDR26DRAFT_937594 [Obelidium mucronatum]
MPPLIAQHSVPVSATTALHVQTVLLGASAFLWADVTAANDQNEQQREQRTENKGRLAALAAAATTRFDGGAAVATPLLASAAVASAASEGLARRVARKTGLLVFAACQLDDRDVLLVAERELMRMLKDLLAAQSSASSAQ